MIRPSASFPLYTGYRAHMHVAMRLAPPFLAPFALACAALNCGGPTFVASSRARVEKVSTPAIDLVRARAYFSDFETQCSADGGKLWGRSLAGPFLFVDSATRDVVANQRGTSTFPTASHGVFVGTLTPAETVANTALGCNLNGTRCSTHSKARATRGNN